MSIFSRASTPTNQLPGAPSFHDALLDPALFGQTFSGPSFSAWRVIAKAMDGESLNKTERDVYDELSGGRRPLESPVSESWFVKGRRSGGSLFAGARAVYVGAFGNFAARLAPGEVATIMLLAADRKQARVLMGYASGFIEASS